MYYRIILFIFILLVSFSCKKDIEEDLSGNWELKKFVYHSNENLNPRLTLSFNHNLFNNNTFVESTYSVNGTDTSQKILEGEMMSSLIRFQEDHAFVFRIEYRIHETINSSSTSIMTHGKEVTFDRLGSWSANRKENELELEESSLSFHVLELDTTYMGHYVGDDFIVDSLTTSWQEYSWQGATGKRTYYADWEHNQFFLKAHSNSQFYFDENFELK